MSPRLIAAATDISSSPVLARRFRGKTAKKIYRCEKGMVVSGSIIKPVGFAIATIPAEMSKEFIYSTIGNIGEGLIGYMSGIGVIRYLYRALEPGKLKATARLSYNIACLPMTIYSMIIGKTFDMLQLSKLEELWFGRPVYIFDDNCLWIEKNFTFKDLFQTVED